MDLHDRLHAYISLVGLYSPPDMASRTSIDILNLDLLVVMQRFVGFILLRYYRFLSSNISPYITLHKYKQDTRLHANINSISVNRIAYIKTSVIVIGKYTLLGDFSWFIVQNAGQKMMKPLLIVRAVEPP